VIRIVLRDDIAFAASRRCGQRGAAGDDAGLDGVGAIMLPDMSM